KSLHVKIVDVEEYEKKDSFFIQLGQPRWLKRGISALLLHQAPPADFGTGTGTILPCRIVVMEKRGKEGGNIGIASQVKLLAAVVSFFFHLADGDKKLSAEEEEAWRIAEMGKPILGENSRLEVIIEESYDFKNTVDKLIKKTNLALVIGTHSWREQFLEAITVSAGEKNCTAGRTDRD
ncbi:hypothetical protein Chor_001941, partial [Crotalus horridus]